MGRRTRQRQEEWAFAVDDAWDLARQKLEDVETVYWELESRLWDDIEEIYNDRGEPPPVRIDLDGKRFFDAWFENGGFHDDEEQDVRVAAEKDELENALFDDIVCVEMVDVDEMDYCFVAEKDVSVWSGEDEYEMVEAGGI